MVAGILLGEVFPDLDDQLDRVKVDTVSLPIAVSLWLIFLAPARYFTWLRARAIAAGASR